MIIAGKYEVISELGRGGMGTVYRVRHLGLNSVFALKVLRANLAEDSELVARFHHEARIMALLHHSSIVRVYDVDAEGDVHYFVMEHIEGRSLDRVLREEGPLPLPKVSALVVQVGEALAHAHAREPAVIYRDIKPSNILIEDKTDRVVVTDFGIAKLLDEQRTLLTRTGGFLGTPKYCAPEQLRGDPNLDGRADIYSLGLVMYEMITGRNFFAAMTDHEVIGKQLFEHSENIPIFERQVSDNLRRLVTRAIAKDRNQRYAAIGDLLADLRKGAGPKQDRSVWPRRLVIPVLVLAALGILVWSWPYLSANMERLPAIVTGLVERLKDALREEPNHPPSFIEVFPDQQRLVAANGVPEFRVTAEDPDGEERDGISYSWTLDGKPLAESSSHLALTDLKVGSFQVEVVARDRRGAEVKHAWTVQVPKPSVPTVLPLEVLPATEKLTLKTCAKQEFLVKEDAHHRRYAWWVDSQAQSEQGARLVFSSDQAGNHEVRVSVTSDAGTASHRWELTITAPAPSQNEVLGWLAEYEQALEQKDMSKLRELGYLRSDDQVSMLEQTPQARTNYEVIVQNVQTEAQSSEVRLRFDQVDRWHDEATYSMVVDRSSRSETLVRRDCDRVVAR